ncbi:MAG: FRG domain-containing protein [Phycisphaerales bacterium]|nr:FRG domain-containing protein [Phycisphaerales bacterium]
MLPSLLRESTIRALKLDGDGLHDPASPARYRVLREESDLFFDFQIRLGRERSEYASCWDTLFAMRHHGLPTRILDWTQTIGVAVYFAVTAGSVDDPCIWILHPYLLNQAHWVGRDTALPKYLGQTIDSLPLADYDDILGHWKHDKLAFRGAVAVCPSRANARMQAQTGTFTIHGTDWRPIDQQVGMDVLRRVMMPPGAVDGARQFLTEAGLTTRVLFPGIDGLAQEMRERFTLR